MTPAEMLGLFFLATLITHLDIVSVGVCCFLFGLASQQYIALAMEWILTRPRRFEPHDPFEHCRGCTL